MVATTRKPFPLGDGRETELIQGIERGMIFWAKVVPNHAVGTEQNHDVPSPWLIVSNNRLHQRNPIVQAAPLTSQLHLHEKFRGPRILLQPEHVIAMPAQGQRALQTPSLVLTEQTRVLSHERLIGQPVARITKSALTAVNAGLRFVLDLPDLGLPSRAP